MYWTGYGNAGSDGMPSIDFPRHARRPTQSERDRAWLSRETQGSETARGDRREDRNRQRCRACKGHVRRIPQERMVAVEEAAGFTEDVRTLCGNRPHPTRSAAWRDSAATTDRVSSHGGLPRLAQWRRRSAYQGAHHRAHSPNRGAGAEASGPTEVRTQRTSRTSQPRTYRKSRRPKPPCSRRAAEYRVCKARRRTRGLRPRSLFAIVTPGVVVEKS